MAEELRQEVSEQNRIRLEKLRALQAEGRNPYALTRYDQTHHSQEIFDNFDAGASAEQQSRGKNGGRKQDCFHDDLS